MEVATDQVDPRGSDRSGDPHQNKKPTPDHRLMNSKVTHTLGLLPKAMLFLVPSAEQLH